MTYTGVARRQWASLVRTPLLGQLSRVDLRVLTSGVGFLRHGRSFLGAGRRSDAPHTVFLDELCWVGARLGLEALYAVPELPTTSKEFHFRLHFGFHAYTQPSLRGIPE